MGKDHIDNGTRRARNTEGEKASQDSPSSQLTITERHAIVQQKVADHRDHGRGGLRNQEAPMEFAKKQAQNSQMDQQAEGPY